MDLCSQKQLYTFFRLGEAYTRDCTAQTAVTLQNVSVSCAAPSSAGNTPQLMCSVLATFSSNWVFLVWIMFHLHFFMQHADDVGSWDTVNKPNEVLWHGLIHRKLELAFCSNMHKILVDFPLTFLALLNSCCSQQMDVNCTDWYSVPES